MWKPGISPRHLSTWWSDFHTGRPDKRWPNISCPESGFIDGAVFCSSDTLAQGALTEIQSRGLSIPDQIAMVGFGDQPFAAHTAPSLTRIKFDRALMGQKAAKALLSRFNNDPVLQPINDVGFQLIERQST